MKNNPRLWFIFSAFIFRANSKIASHLGLSLFLLTIFSGVACRRQEVVHVRLQAHSQPGQDTSRQEIRAQIAGVQTGLHYKWVAEAGQCDPQESDWPATIFCFTPGAPHDRVTVEVWRENVRVAHEHIDVTVAELPSPAPVKPMPALQVEITGVPPFEPHGGPNTHADISGRVSGEIVADLKIVLYARADEVWYIQPSPYKAHAIHVDHTWSAWTHTGSDYAALVVRPTFAPAMICDVLPQVGGDVLARVMVEGKKN